MPSPIAGPRAFRWWALSTIASLSFGCELVPVTGIASNDGGSETGPQGPVTDGPVLERVFTPNLRETLGRTCVTDADCPLLTCVKPTDTSMGGGGPAHGYCSITCTAADDPVCKAADGACLNFAPAGAAAQNWCVQTCRRGGPTLEMDKCRARTDVACTPSSVSNGQVSIAGYCLPTCNNDAECGARHCSPSSGVCLDAVAGNSTGAACSIAGNADGGADGGGADTDGGDADTDGGDADTDGADGGIDANGDESVGAEGDGDSDAGTDAGGDAGTVSIAVPPSSCAGVCLNVVSAHVCAQRCTFGSPTACHPPEGPVTGSAGAYSACVFVAQNGSTSLGDEAHCGQLCDSEADCLDQRDPGLFCNKSDLATSFGHGFCDWAPPVVDAAASAP